MLKRLLSALLVVGVGILPSGCYIDVGKDGTSSSKSSSGSTAGGSSSAPTDTETLVGKVLVRGIAGLMAIEIFVVLTAFGCNEDVAAGIALGFFDAVVFGLQTTVNPDDALAIGPYVAQYAVTALGKATITLPAGVTKEQAIEGIVEGLLKSVGKNGSFSLSTADKTKLLASFAGSATAGIGAAAVDDRDAAIASVTKGMIGHIGDAGVDSTAAVANGQAMMTAVVAAFATAGVSGATEIEAALTPALRAAVAALTTAGITDAASQDAVIQGLTSGATAGLKQTGLSSAEQATVSAAIATGVAQGMTDLGAAQSRIDDAKTTLSMQINGVLTANGVDPVDSAAAADAAQAAIAKYGLAGEETP